MTQTLLAYGAVLLAGAWVVWSVLLPRSLKQKLRAGGKPKGKAGCGSPDCGCGD